MIRFDCPVCQKSLKVAGELAGKAGKCPACGERVKVPSVNDEVRPELIVPAPHKTRTLTAPQSPTESIPRSGRVTTRVMTVEVKQQAKASHSLGIASLVLGLIAFLICWVPFLGLLGLPLSILGAVLGGIGLIIAMFRKGSGIGFPIAGTCLSLFSILAVITITGATASVIEEVGKAIDDSSQMARASQQTLVSAGSSDQSEASKAASVPAEAQSAAPEKSATARAWHNAQEPIHEADLQLRVTGVTIGQVALKDAIDRETKSQEKLLIVSLELTNVNATRKMNYTSWSGKTISFVRDYATMEDNFGNSYKRINFGFGTSPLGSVEDTASIYPKETITDVLVFEKPIDAVKFIRIEFPAENFGGTGMLRLEIPKEMIIF
jgi:hypothetical protein